MEEVTKDKTWYRIGGYAALMALAILLIEAVVIVVIQAVWLNSGQFGASFGGN
jgi:hypothetical protein